MKEGKEGKERSTSAGCRDCRGTGKPGNRTQGSDPALASHASTPRPARTTLRQPHPTWRDLAPTLAQILKIP